MAFVLTIPIETIESIRTVETATLVATAAPIASVASVAFQSLELRRLRRVVAHGPRCPDCAGPLVFGEGCQLCPVCGYSGCGGGG